MHVLTFAAIACVVQVLFEDDPPFQVYYDDDEIDWLNLISMFSHNIICQWHRDSIVVIASGSTNEKLYKKPKSIKSL